MVTDYVDENKRYLLRRITFGDMDMGIEYRAGFDNEVSAYPLVSFYSKEDVDDAIDDEVVYPVSELEFKTIECIDRLIEGLQWLKEETIKRNQTDK